MKYRKVAGVSACLLCSLPSKALAFFPMLNTLKSFQCSSSQRARASPDLPSKEHLRRIGVLRSTKDKVADTGNDVRLEDRDVLQAHRGLHDFLYGESEDHGATAKDGSAESYDGTSLYEAKQWMRDNEDSRHSAVYAVIGKDKTVNFVGVSRNVAVALKAHLTNEGEDKVQYVKVRSFKFPQRDKMEELKRKWITECGETPLGNTEGKEWANSAKDSQGSMSQAQRESYEENKLKMRKAMADAALVDEMEQMSAEDLERRKRLELSVEGDDWSGVIDGQTKLTQEPKPEEASATIISPFSSDGLPLDGVGADGMAIPRGDAAPPPAQISTGSEDAKLDFTADNVDKVLDEVRPYLIADGGNVRVMGVEEDTRVVKLALQGACGSCPSSTTTMKMGIEKVLNENFSNLGGVEQVDEASGNAMAEVTVSVVEAILEPLRPAMVAMRAQVEVLSAMNGIVKLSYKGHRKVAYGIEMALMDNPLIRGVEFVYRE